LLIRALLEKEGHRVELVDSGAEAIDAVRKSRFDVVLMDVRMPGMDGLETTRRIRALGGLGGRVPIIGLTAHTLRNDVERCLAAGMDGHLAKPLERDTLLAAVANAGGEAAGIEFTEESSGPGVQLRKAVNEQAGESWRREIIG
jgi:two-component system, sensor histidine kinase